jgi:Xaa-Pro aminopeptidase
MLNLKLVTAIVASAAVVLSSGVYAVAYSTQGKSNSFIKKYQQEQKVKRMQRVKELQNARNMKQMQKIKNEREIQKIKKIQKIQTEQRVKKIYPLHSAAVL